MVNRPAQDKTLIDLLPPDTGPPDFIHASDPIYSGGPAEARRSFVLHSPDYVDHKDSLRIGRDFAMTSSDHIIADLLAGRGPQRRLVALGYAAWGAGQLDSEMRENAWFTVAATPDLVFGGPDAQKWRDAIGAIGIDPAAISGLSAQHGHA